MESFPIGIPIERPDGTRVVFERRRRNSHGSGGSTARHEARHAVAAEANGTSVVFASIIPGPGYLGITQLSGFDAVAAAAPHAHGDGGTSHDVAVIRMAGENVSGAARAAKNILSERGDQVEAVADALESAGSLSGPAIRRIMAEAKTPEFVMRIISPRGKILQEKSVHTAELPKAA